MTHSFKTVIYIRADSAFDFLAFSFNTEEEGLELTILLD